MQRIGSENALDRLSSVKLTQLNSIQLNSIHNESNSTEQRQRQRIMVMCASCVCLSIAHRTLTVGECARQIITHLYICTRFLFISWYSVWLGLVWYGMVWFGLAWRVHKYMRPYFKRVLFRSHRIMRVHSTPPVPQTLYSKPIFS